MEVPARFETGELLAGRYSVVRFIAQGGMGEVYEVEDRELHERLALKTIRGDYASHEGALGRFRREVHLARRVTHPNVARVYDLAVHDGLVFLTMELLRGETLAQLLSRKRSLSPAEALPLVTQMAEGLAAAHDAGVVHRDFKCGNVILVGSGEAVRAVVTDFGLARSVQGDEGRSPASSMTATDMLVGTPVYMAPEQLEGHPATAASDLYALGLVMYEMVTGVRPFAGETPYALAARRLHEEPPSPRSVRPDVPRRWERTVLRALARRPEDRFASARDVVRALGGQEPPSGPRERARRRLRRLVALSAALLLAVAALLSTRSERTPARTASEGALARRSLAVLGFRNLSGRTEAAWLSTTLTELLSAELAAGGAVRTIPGETVGRARLELSLEESEAYSPEALRRVRANLGVDLVVHGSYLVAEEGGREQIRLYVRLQDVAREEPVVTLTETGTEATLVTLVSSVGEGLRQKLGVAAVTAEAKEQLRARLPESPEAARLYAEGLARLRRFDALGARDALERAIQAAPSSALATSVLAEAHAALGYDEKAKETARRALSLAGGLSREDRLAVEARAHELARGWDEAIAIGKLLSGFFPDSLEYGLMLARVQTSGGKPKDALATVETLRKQPPPAGTDPRLDLAEALAAEGLSDFRRQEAAGRRAAERGRATGARLLTAAGRHLQGGALADLSEYQKAIAALVEGRSLFLSAGDASGAARCLNLEGLAHKNLGDLGAARRAFTESLATFRRAGHRRNQAAVLNNLASLAWAEDDLSGAKETYEEALAISREIGDRRGVASRLNNLGLVRKDQGDLAGARATLEETLGLSREMGDRNGIAIRLYNLAEVLRLRGDLPGATERLSEALRLSRETGQKRQIAYALYGLGETQLLSGDLVAARLSHEEALALRTEMSEKVTLTESRLALARLTIDEVDLGTRARPPLEGTLANARTSVEGCLVEIRRERAKGKEAAAEEVLARLALLAGDRAGAVAAVDRAQGLVSDATSPQVRIRVALTAAAVAGDRRQEVARLVAETRRLGLLPLHLEARLLVSRPLGPGALEALAREAESRGIGLVARRARTGYRHER